MNGVARITPLPSPSSSRDEREALSLQWVQVAQLIFQAGKANIECLHYQYLYFSILSQEAKGTTEEAHYQAESSKYLAAIQQQCANDIDNATKALRNAAYYSDNPDFDQDFSRVFQVVNIIRPRPSMEVVYWLIKHFVCTS